MTPSRFSVIAQKLQNHALHCLLVTVLGVGISIGSMFLSVKYSVFTNPFPIFCLGGFIMMWGWGMLCTSFWDRTIRNIVIVSQKYPRLVATTRYESIGRWTMAICLDAWFISSFIWLYLAVRWKN